MGKFTNLSRELQQKIGYGFQNEDLMVQAFTRSSFSAQHGGENNEVLEFIGDRVLDFYVVKIIAQKYGSLKCESEFFDKENDLNEYCILAHKNESDFTEIKKELVSNKFLAKKIDDLDIIKHLYLGDCDIENHVEKQDKVKADLFESIVGAIAIDSKWNNTSLEKSISKMLDIKNYLKEITVEEVIPELLRRENAVTTLKEFGEHGVCSIPKYDLSETPVFSEGYQWWKCTCSVKSWGISKTRFSTSKKEAKREAAYAVICQRFGIKNEYEGEK